MRCGQCPTRCGVLFVCTDMRLSAGEIGNGYWEQFMSMFRRHLFSEQRLSPNLCDGVKILVFDRGVVCKLEIVHAGGVLLVCGDKGRSVFCWRLDHIVHVFPMIVLPKYVCGGAIG